VRQNNRKNQAADGARTRSPWCAPMWPGGPHAGPNWSRAGVYLLCGSLGRPPWWKALEVGGGASDRPRMGASAGPFRAGDLAGHDCSRAWLEGPDPAANGRGRSTTLRMGTAGNLGPAASDLHPPRRGKAVAPNLGVRSIPSNGNSSTNGALEHRGCGPPAPTTSEKHCVKQPHFSVRNLNRPKSALLKDVLQPWRAQGEAAPSFEAGGKKKNGRLDSRPQATRGACRSGSPPIAGPLAAGDFSFSEWGHDAHSDGM